MAEEETFLERLIHVQNELEVPKNQYNKFGDFYYRNLDDIQEAVKPLLKENKLFLGYRDEIIVIEGRLFYKSIAYVQDIKDTKECKEATGLAEIPKAKAKMDESQVTGSAGSYARKYALNSLFLIDDSKDNDTDEFKKLSGNQNDKPKNNQAINALGNTLKQIANLASIRDRKSYTENAVYEGICSQVVGKIIPFDTLTPQQLQQIQLQANAMLQQFNASK